MMDSRAIAHCSYSDSNNASCFYKNTPIKESNILRRVQRTCKKFQQKPLPSLFKSRLDGTSSTWKVFTRLQMATEYADTCTKDCMVFSFEEKIGNCGQRKFLVAHPEQLWQNHRSRQLYERCSYEIIRENFPCKLYFDLEYYSAFNQEKNGSNMTEIFIKCVIASMYEQQDILLKDSDFLWLDSSNESKFSCHLILQMKSVAFQNNIQAGMFVSLLLSTLNKRINDNAPSNGLWPSSEEIKTLLVKSKQEKEFFFCDEGVYSRNRNFRIYLSTKYGKRCPLILSSYNKYVPQGSSKCKEEAVFYDSLITYFRNHNIDKFLSYEEKIQSSMSSHAKGTKIKSGISGCSTSSPFPELDSYILRIITDDFAVGFIRKWTYFSKEHKLVYDIGNYRYCGNIGRHHKSNNIKIIVDMKAKYFYQVCLDPDCRQQSYQSESTPIPDDIFSATIPDDFFDAGCFSQLVSVENNKENIPDIALHSLEIFNCSKSDNCDDHKAENNCEAAVCNDKADDSFINNAFDNEWINEQIFNKAEFSFEEFSENKMSDSCKINGNKSYEMNIPVQTGIKKELCQDSWYSFFVDDFTCSESKTKQEDCENPNGDFGFRSNENSWIITDSPMKDSIISLGNISYEEEMLMVEAVDVTEATLNENIFSEETMF